MGTNEMGDQWNSNLAADNGPRLSGTGSGMGPCFRPCLKHGVRSAEHQATNTAELFLASVEMCALIHPRFHPVLFLDFLFLTL